MAGSFRISAVMSEIEPGFSFSIFALRGVGYEPEAIGIRQLTHKSVLRTYALPPPAPLPASPSCRLRAEAVGHTGRR